MKNNFVVGEPAPAWELPDALGNKLSSEICKGQITVLHFWATWGAASWIQVFNMIPLQTQYLLDGVMVIGISLDTNQNLANKFLDRYRCNYLAVFGNTSTVWDFDINWQTGCPVPVVVIIDRDGNVAGYFRHYRPPAVYQQVINSLLEKEKSQK